MPEDQPSVIVSAHTTLDRWPPRTRPPTKRLLVIGWFTHIQHGVVYTWLICSLLGINLGACLRTQFEIFTFFPALSRRTFKSSITQKLHDVIVKR